MARTGRELHVWSESFVAGEDLSDKQYYVVKMDTGTDGQVELADSDTTGIGILLNKPKQGQAASVMLLGMSKAVVSGALGNGVEASIHSSGRLKAASVGDIVIGITNTTAAAANDIVELLLLGRHYKHV